MYGLVDKFVKMGNSSYSIHPLFTPRIYRPPCPLPPSPGPLQPHPLSFMPGRPLFRNSDSTRIRSKQRQRGMPGGGEGVSWGAQRGLACQNPRAKNYYGREFVLFSAKRQNSTVLLIFECALYFPRRVASTLPAPFSPLHTPCSLLARSEAFSD